MYLQSAGGLQHADQVFDCSSPDDGIIHQNDSLSFDGRFQDIQLDFDTVFPFLLAWFDKGSSHVAVLVKNQFKGNAGFFGISHGSDKAGIRNACHKIGIYRIGFCQGSTAAETGVIDADIVNLAVQAGEIDVFKYTVRMKFLLEAEIRLQAVLCDRNNLAGGNITENFSAC